MKDKNIDQIEIEGVSIKDRFASIIESVLFVSGEAVKLKDLSQIIDCDTDYVESILNVLQEKYDSEDRGIRLAMIGDSYQLITKKENSKYVQRLLNTNIRQTLSQASLETLAIVAYKQPITRMSIDDIRGVKSDSAVVTLTEKGLIKEAGRLDVPGRPILYVTTDEFLKHFGLDSIKKLLTLEKLAFDEKIDLNEEVASDVELPLDEEVF
ncbi:MAG TPA: SMC-Scp complex subunit ScpB [Clostridiaceae bacterium]